MRRSLSVLLVTATTLPCSAGSSSPASCQHSATAFRCVKYLRNYDADTITFFIPDVHPLIGEKVGVRVRGIDAPEIKGHLPCERESAKIAKRLIENLLKNGRRIDLENVDRDKYFRILADVKVDSVSLKDVLLRNGLGYAYEGGTKERRDWCRRLPAAQIKR